MSDLHSMALNCNRLIEASAGTGKTRAITDLYLRLLLGRDTGLRPLAVNEILTLTFTNAATAELRHRVRGRISEARRVFRGDAGPETDDEFLSALARNSPDRDADRQRLDAAAGLLDEACIFTLHGFCNKVLKEHPFDTGILFQQEMGEADDSQLLREICADCYRDLPRELSPFERTLAARLWGDPEALANALKPYVDREAIRLTPPVDDAAPQALEQLLNDIEQAKRDWIEQDAAQQLAPLLKGGRKPLTRLEAMTEFCGGDDLGLLDVKDNLWEIYRLESLEKALKKDAALPEAAGPLWELIDGIAARKGPVITALKANLWHQVLGDARKRMGDIKESRQLIAVNDLLTKTRDALRNAKSDLASLLAQRWPVAMIDEFQDTDQIQYEIFHCIYPPEEESGDRGLLMIGDPKQAIYQFRGADVYAYINARRDVGEARIHSLDKNWRSTPALVEAVNALFGNEGVFGNDKDIPFQPVEAARRERKMTINSKEVKPFELFIVKPRSDDRDFVSMADARQRAMNYAACQTAQLLNKGKKVRLHGKEEADETLKAGEIAFLVRTGKDAELARQALEDRGIKSVYLTKTNVLEQPLAQDLLCILQAALEPAADGPLRAALAAPLLRCRAEDIARLDRDFQHRQTIAREFQDYHEVWRREGVAAMLSRLLRERRLAWKWLGQPEGERTLTDFRHLTELLQQGEALAPGMRRLVNWFAREMQSDDAEAEQRQLRLESDENLVKIVTMHSAKGLEYDVVMIPMPVFGVHKNDGPALHHDDAQGKFGACLEVGEDGGHRYRAEKESLDEDARLLYVAMTRAKYRCYLGLPLTRNLGDSALAQRVLMPVPQESSLLQIHLKIKSGRLFISDSKTAGAKAQRGARELPDHLFAVVDEAEKVNDAFCNPPPPPQSLQAPPPLPPIDRSRREHSYSGLYARLREQEEEVGAAEIAGFADEEPDARPADGEEDGAVALETPEAATFSRFSFPRGRRVGVVLHQLLEDLDPAAPRLEREQACDAALSRLDNALDLGRHRKAWLETLAGWLDDMLATPLAPLKVSLEQIGGGDRLNEMQFHFPVADPGRALAKLREAGCLEGFRPVENFAIKGMMTGLVDLTFRHEGKHYVLDYKSNHLGDSFADYGGESLNAAVAEHHYDLQYLIYSVALHKWLRARLPGYAYDKHFGGVFYLFLRGLQGRDGDGSGVYFHRPPGELIQTLDGLLSGLPPAGINIHKRQ